MYLKDEILVLLLVLWNEILVFGFLGSGFRILEIGFLTFGTEFYFFERNMIFLEKSFGFLIDFWFFLYWNSNFGFWPGDKILDFRPGTEFWIWLRDKILIFVRNGILDFDLETKFRRPKIQNLLKSKFRWQKIQNLLKSKFRWQKIQKFHKLCVAII